MKEKFLKLAKENIHRDGIDDLLQWLEDSDFFISPASSKYHGSYEGALPEHSINVYDRLVMLYKMLYGENSITKERLETITITSLMHDLTKIGCYKKDFRNVKNDDGKWEKVPCYTFNEDFKFGYHGCKSVYLIQKYIKLTDEEAVAIANHMGAYDRQSGDYVIAQVFEQYPLAFLLHTADCFASFIDENKSSENIDTFIQTILDLCKEIISNGIDKEIVYDIISKENDGKKNPNSVKDIGVAKKIIELLKEKMNG